MSQPAKRARTSQSAKAARTTPKARRKKKAGNGWGGARKGAGRKPGPDPKELHRARPDHVSTRPVLVRLRARIAELRSPQVFAAIRRAILRSGQRDERFRIVHFSVQPDEVWMLVEAKDAFWLSSGMRSVTIRIARYVNDDMGRSGSLWSDRWNGRTIKTPQAMRAALVEVLGAFRRGGEPLPRGIDPYSSAAWFDGFEGWQPNDGKTPPLAVASTERRAWLPWAAWGKDPPEGAAPDAADCPVLPARSTLARSGWREEGLIGLDEGPARQAEKPKRGRARNA